MHVCTWQARMLGMQINVTSRGNEVQLDIRRVVGGMRTAQRTAVLPGPRVKPAFGTTLPLMRAYALGLFTAVHVLKELHLRHPGCRLHANKRFGSGQYLCICVEDQHVRVATL